MTYRFRIATFTDKRVNLMDEIINGMKVIKLYCWEYHFTKIIADIRRYALFVYMLGNN